MLDTSLLNLFMTTVGNDKVESCTAVSNASSPALSIISAIVRYAEEQSQETHQFLERLSQLQKA